MSTYLRPLTGQRWISENDTRLGLGIVVAVDDRTATLLFPACEESRIYSLRQAAIARIRFSVGDRVYPLEGTDFIVESVSERSGILTYHGVDAQLMPCQVVESRLNHQIHLSKPQDRLLAGQLDNIDWFHLRYDTLLYRQQLQRHPGQGLIGARIDWLPHQIYVAHEVSERHAPRVLLADEVGLGKTIEAGLIMSRQWTQGKIQRILLIVPQPLLHQWLVEMRRKFNLLFSLLDKERLSDARTSAPDENPLQQQQFVLLSLEQLLNDACLQNEARTAGFDMLVVDEAHHLQWDQDHPSAAYQVIATLSQVIPALLLLTATPEQLGIESHFARLHLLDPHHFHDLSQFLEQEGHARPVADLACSLADSAHPITEELLLQIQELLPDQLQSGDHEFPDAPDTRQRWLTALLDRHSTGRVLFRNTRAAISGFMPRHLHTHYLTTLPAAEHDLIARVLPDLLGLLKKLRQEKVLLITHLASTAIALEERLRLYEGIRTSMFHEEMSLLERDRAAAYFAEAESGARLMLCSEIGSEGRNFQFCHHLILLDLPDNPDLLEQRIGRLDRIGQTQAINIHVLVAAGSREERLLQWYHEGLDAIEQPCAVAQPLLAQLGDTLHTLLLSPGQAQWSAFIAHTKALRQTLLLQWHEGRDRLLELSSCRTDRVTPWLEALRETDDSPQLQHYMETIFQRFKVELDDHGEPGLYILKPTDQMLMEQFPGLSNDGMTLTYDRQLALQREDVQFFSWEHPVVQSCMDLLEYTELGNTNVALLRNKAIAKGTLLIEALFLPVLQAPACLQLETALEQTFIRILLDRHGNDLSQKVSHPTLRRQLHHLDREKGRLLIRENEALIRQRLEQAEALAHSMLQPYLEQAQQRTRQRWQFDYDRLCALRNQNPAVRQEEIDHVHSVLQQSLQALHHSRLQLHALRLVIAGETLT